MPVATIALLLKNAQPYLKEILDAIQAQAVRFEVELLAIDSGSKDQTLEILNAYPVRVLQIDPGEFNHGETRNQAVREADPSSRFIVFLTQDAIPRDAHWLPELLAPFQESSSFAGVCSRHIPRPHASVSTVRQLTTLTQTGGKNRLIKKFPDSPDEYYRNQLDFVYFSNTSSAIRRDVWEKYPFRQVDFAEDACWADEVLRAGYSLVYEPKSQVVHSHDYSITEQFRQHIDHAYAMNHLFHPPSYHSTKTWLRLFLGIPLQVWRDLKFMQESEYTRGESTGYKICSMLRSPFWHLATVSGGWIGAHLEAMPPGLRKILSRQERLRGE